MYLMGILGRSVDLKLLGCADTIKKHNIKTLKIDILSVNEFLGSLN